MGQAEATGAPWYASHSRNARLSLPAEATEELRRSYRRISYMRHCPQCPAAGDLSIADESGGVSLKTGSSVSVSGDAIINNRKKKLIPSYELEVKGTWAGKLLSSTECMQISHYGMGYPLHHKPNNNAREMCLGCRQCKGRWTS